MEELASWRLRLLECNFEIVHSAGVKHETGDALSALPTTGIDNTKSGHKISVMGVACTKSHNEKKKIVVTSRM